MPKEIMVLGIDFTTNMSCCKCSVSKGLFFSKFTYVKSLNCFWMRYLCSFLVCNELLFLVGISYKVKFSKKHVISAVREPGYLDNI